MPVYHGNREVEVKWVRYGGIESDETLDIMTFYMFVEWNSERGTNNGDLIPYNRDKVNELKLTDFGMTLPSDSYIVMWDKEKPNIDFSEYLSKAVKVFNPVNEYDFIKVVCKGHDFKYTYDKHKILNEWKDYDGKEYYSFATYKKSSKPIELPEMVLRMWGVAFKGDVNMNENDLKWLCIRMYVKRLCKGMANENDKVNEVIGKIHTNFDNIKEVIKNLRIERGLN